MLFAKRTIVVLTLLSSLIMASVSQATGPTQVSLPWYGHDVNIVPNVGPGATGGTVFFTGDASDWENGCGADDLYATYRGTIQLGPQETCPGETFGYHLIDDMMN